MEKILKKQAKDFMTKDVIAVKKNETVKHLFKLFDQGGILGVPVIDEGRKVIGIVTETDLIKHFTTLKAPRSINLLGGIVYLDDIKDFNEQLKEHCAETVKDIMFGPAITVKGEATLLEIINLMSDKHITRVPVVDAKGKLIGIITRTDIVHELAKVKKI
jgi:CBS domain-containing protein